MSKHPMSADLRHPAMVFGRRFHEICLAAADELDRLHAASEWRPIRDEQRPSGVVLTGHAGIECLIACGWCASCERWELMDGSPAQYADEPWLPTHWLPLPQPPKGNT